MHKLVYSLCEGIRLRLRLFHNGVMDERRLVLASIHVVRMSTARNCGCTACHLLATVGYIPCIICAVHAVPLASDG